MSANIPNAFSPYSPVLTTNLSPVGTYPYLAVYESVSTVSPLMPLETLRPLLLQETDRDIGNYKLEDVKKCSKHALWLTVPDSLLGW